MVQPYKHEPFTDFTIEENKKAFEEALKQVKEELGQHHDLLIDGDRIRTDNTITSTNPADTKQVVGTVSKANEDLAEKAVQSRSEEHTSELQSHS